MSEPRTPGFVEPRSLVFWTFVGLVIVGIYWRITGMFDLWGSDSSGLYVSVGFWMVSGLVVAWLIYRSQLFEHRPVSATIAAVAWGLFVVGGITTLVGEDLRSLVDKLLGFEASRDWGPSIRAPFFEETLKLLGVVALALIPRVRLTRVVDGVYYGMLSGLGFLISENIFFTNQDLTTGGMSTGEAIFGEFLTRGVFALPISHIVYTGIAGAGVGYVMSRRGRPLPGRLGVAVGLYLTAFLLHGFQNSPILDEVAAGLLIKGIPALVIFILVAWWARREYRSDLSGLADGLTQLSGEDFASLSSRRRRRKAAKASEDVDKTRAFQHAQIGYLVAADTYGASSPEADKAASALPTT